MNKRVYLARNDDEKIIMVNSAIGQSFNNSNIFEDFDTKQIYYKNKELTFLDIEGTLNYNNKLKPYAEVYTVEENRHGYIKLTKEGNKKVWEFFDINNDGYDTIFYYENDFIFEDKRKKENDNFDNLFSSFKNNNELEFFDIKKDRTYRIYWKFHKKGWANAFVEYINIEQKHNNVFLITKEEETINNILKIDNDIPNEYWYLIFEYLHDVCSIEDYNIKSFDGYVELTINNHSYEVAKDFCNEYK